MEEMTFFMSVHDQQDDARKALESVRRHYPSERIILFSCGHDMGFDELASGFGCDGRRTPNLHLSCHGGILWRRILEVFLELPSRWLLKIDPDSRCHRRISLLPSRDVVFGHVQPCEPEGFLHVQGGCKGVALGACEKMLESGVFDDPMFKDPSTYCGPERLASLLRNGLGCEDRYTQVAYDRLGIEIVRLPEIYSVYRGEVPENKDLRYAFTHPHKT